MKKVAYLIIIIGILVTFSPFIKDMYRSYMEHKLLDEYSEIQSDVDSSGVGILADNTSVVPSISPNASQVKITSTPQTKKTNSAIGVLEIPKINLKLPILNGSTTANLDIAATLVSGTVLPGKVGTSAIAAHRSYTYGRFFNRLAELANGDKVIVTMGKNKFEYSAYDKKIVLPSDNSVLANTNDKILALITCDPMKNPTHRLIIFTKQI